MLPNDPRKKRPFYTAEVKRYLTERKAYYDQKTATTNEALRIRGIVRKYMGEVLPNDRSRKLALGWLFPPPDGFIHQISTNDLLFSEAYALRDWIDPQKFGDVWLSAPTFADELRWVARVAEETYSKQHPEEPQQINLF